MNTALLVIAVVGLVVPALFLAAHPDPTHRLTHTMSEFVAALLILGYALSLVYSMGTHRAVFGGRDAGRWPAMAGEAVGRPRAGRCAGRSSCSRR